MRNLYWTLMNIFILSSLTSPGLCIQVETYVEITEFSNLGKKAAALCSNPVRLTVSVTFSAVERVTHLYEVWSQPQASRRGQHTRRCTFSLPPKVLPCPPQSMVWKEELKERSNSSTFTFIHFHFGLVEAISEWILAHRAILIRRIHNLWEWLECQGARFEWFTTARFDVLLS